MTNHTTIPKVSRLEVITTGARWRWTLEEKQRIVAESFSVPRNASATARRYGLSNGQLFTWRRQAREGKLVMDGDDAGFTPVIVVSERSDRAENNRPPRSISSAPADRRMEIVLSDGRRVIVGSDVDVAALARVIEVLDTHFPRHSGRSPNSLHPSVCPPSPIRASTPMRPLWCCNL